MEERIQHVVLIDDNKTTNLLNKYLMLKSKRFVKIESFIDPESVLHTLEHYTSYTPDLIFLDLDMPTMDGWEFIARFEKLTGTKKSKTKIFILTSIYTEWKSNLISGNLCEYLIKSLNLDVIESLYYKYFDSGYHLDIHK